MLAFIRCIFFKVISTYTLISARGCWRWGVRRVGLRTLAWVRKTRNLFTEQRLVDVAHDICVTDDYCLNEFRVLLLVL